MNWKRWVNNSKSIFIDFFSGIGLFWLVIEIFSYSTDGAADKYFKSVTVFVLAALLVILFSLWKNKPKTCFGYHLRGKDSYVEVKVGDAFDNIGALVVPVNNQFDMTLGGNVVKANSIQNQLIRRFYSGKAEHILTDLSSKINIGNSYDIGKTVEVEQNGKKFYFVVNSTKNENNRVKSEIDDFISALNGLWQYIALESGRDSAVTIPLINTQHGRDSYLTRKGTIKEIIASYIDASKSLNICEKLIISIYPDDLKKGQIDLDEIDEFLKFSCKHYRQVILGGKKEGEEQTSSKVIKIEN
ncbi:MAG: hypothetical protein BWY19_00743 [bacterium ADurb.Bin212]|nr:MAG: hypothetical protein BWY19_00743 [bacterium ADurb.Bin212]